MLTKRILLTELLGFTVNTVISKWIEHLYIIVTYVAFMSFLNGAKHSFIHIY